MQGAQRQALKYATWPLENNRSIQVNAFSHFKNRLQIQKKCCKSKGGVSSANQGSSLGRVLHDVAWQTAPCTDLPSPLQASSWSQQDLSTSLHMQRKQSSLQLEPIRFVSWICLRNGCMLCDDMGTQWPTATMDMEEEGEERVLCAFFGHIPGSPEVELDLVRIIAAFHFQEPSKPLPVL